MNDTGGMFGLVRGLVGFAGRVLAGFRANQGLLLSGAVAYYTLLSIIPVFTLLLIGLTHVLEEARLMRMVADQLVLIIPDHSEAVVAQIADLLANRHVVGWVGIAVLLFFSSLAFTVLENAMSVIFFHRVRVRRRHFMLSAVLPYLFIGALGIGLLLITLVSGALQSMEAERISLFGWNLELAGAVPWTLYLLGVFGLVLLLTSLYMVMPVGQLQWSHALVGGITATALWEIARHVLVWYFSTLSLVNLVYGTFATTVVILLSLEVGAVILLLGAQVIAEYERSIGSGPRTVGDQGFHTPD